MPTALFIGGHADGRWIDVPDGEDRWQIPEYPEVSYVADVGMMREQQMMTIRRHIYKVDSLRSKFDSWRVFVPLHFDGRDWIEMLLRGYRRPAVSENEQ